jgi:hypothetical protein
MSYRSFEAGPDPFGRKWHVDFRWLQTGISIRHADTVDVKFIVRPVDPSQADEPGQERVIALPHPDLLTLSNQTGHPLNDPWCLRMAALHLKHMIETGEDLDKTLVTLSLHEMEQYAKLSAGNLAEPAASAAVTR